MTNMEKIYNSIEKITLIPPLLIGGYMVNKLTDTFNIDIDKLNDFYNILSSNMQNTISLVSSFSGAMLLGNKDRRYRIAGSVCLALNNIYFINYSKKTHTSKQSVG